MTGASVARLWRYPVKSMRGEEVTELAVAPGGVIGDRGYAFYDLRLRRIASAKRHAALLQCQARYLAVPAAAEPVPPIEVTFPDGSVVRDDAAELTRRVQELLDDPVRLTTGTPGELVDLAPVHVLATSTLRRLSAAYPAGDWDARRLRPNILIDDDAAEEGWLSCDLHIGADAVVHVVTPTARCVMTTLAQGDLPRDRNVLATLARVGRRQVGALGEYLCAGSYAEVVRPGVVRAGDPVGMERVAPRRGVIAAAIGVRSGQGDHDAGQARP